VKLGIGCLVAISSTVSNVNEKVDSIHGIDLLPLKTSVTTTVGFWGMGCKRLPRAHQSLGQDSPCKQHGSIEFDRSKIRRERLVDGLIVDDSIVL
jgi:hypothetical protein